MSETPLEEEEEEEIDEETSIDGLEGVENSSMKMTRVTLFWRKTKAERCWRLRGHKKRQEISKVRLQQSRYWYSLTGCPFRVLIQVIFITYFQFSRERE